MAMWKASRWASPTATAAPAPTCCPTSTPPSTGWLAQRIPVRVKIDQVPEGVRLVAGQTATVSVNPPETARDDGAPRHS